MTVLVLAAVPAVLAVAVWAVTDLEKFVLFALLGSSVIPASLFKSSNANVAAVDLLLLVALAAWLITNSLRISPDPAVRGNPILLPALLFVGVNWISLAWSINTHSTITKGLQLIELFVLFPAVFASIPRSVAAIRHGLTLLVALTVGLALATLVAYLGASSHSQGTYLAGFNKNAIGGFLAAGVILAYVLQTRVPRPGAKSALLAAVLIAVLGMVASGSRGAMLGAAAGILVVSLLLKRGKVTGVAVVTLLAALYLAVVAPAVAHKQIGAGGYDSSAVRLHIWHNAVRKIEHHPILGTGDGSYWDAQYGQGDPNNLFLLTWAEVGVPGMIALVFFLAKFGGLLARARRLPDENSVLAVGAGGVIVSALVHSQVDVAWTRGTYSLVFALLGIMVALVRLAPVRSPELSVRRSGAPSAGEQPALIGSR